MTFRRVVLALLVLLGAACAARPEHCWVCDREIHPQVRATLTLRGGRTAHACCPRCALHYRVANPGALGGIAVTDYPSGSSLSIDAAWMVEGSDETPCMHHPPVADPTRTPMQVCYDRCLPSLIAFRLEAQARAFAAEHGGTVLSPGSYPPAP